MPKYTTKKAAIAKRRQKTVTKSISRDKRILKRWAATGSAADYEKLRKYATKLADKAPDYVLPEVLKPDDRPPPPRGSDSLRWQHRGQ